MIVGRDGELREISALIAGAAAGDGGALVLRGEAGIGKSVLLEHTVRQAAGTGLRTLGAAGVQAEVHIPYAALHRLLRSSSDVAAGADDVLDAPGTLPFRAAMMLLDAIRAAAGPVLITVEDLQWLDESSWEALAFVARRLGAERAAMLLTARDDGTVDRRLNGAGLRELRLPRLDRPESQALLDRVVPRLVPRLRTRVLELAEGNPLGLVELGGAAARSGAAALLPGSVPLSERVERTFSGLVAGLPAPTRSLLLVAALDDGDDLAEMVRAGRLLGSGTGGPGDLDPAVATRLVQVDDRFRVRFRHPLLRSALTHSATAAQRRRVHAALAGVLAGDPERSVWHRAAAADGPDEDLARELTATATRARHRQASGIALAAFERAARLSVDAAARGRRLLAAADMAIEQGDPAAQERLLIEVRPLDLSPGDRVVHELRVEMLHATRWSGAQQVARVAEVVGTLSAAGAHEQAMRLVDAIALRCFYGEPHPDTIARLVTAVGRAMGGSDDPMLPAYLAMISPVVHGREVRGRLRELLDRGGTDANLTHHLGMAASAVADFPASCAFHAVAAIGLRAQGRLGFLAHTQISHAMAALCLGDAQTATALLPEAEAIVREIGSPNWVPTALTTAGAACALRGDLAAAEERTTAAEAMLVSYGRNPLLALVRRARGLTALAGGRPAEALGEFRRVLDPADDSYHPYTGYLLAGHMAEAAAGCGDFGELRRLADELGPVADVSGSPALLAGLGYARAVLADTAEAWDKALGEDLPEWPFEQARRRHAYGAWLRRRRRPADSRPLLRAAAATFDALGATAWADRSRAELRASGESLRRPAQAAGRLTPQEALIARLAAEGLSNRDIAERLFLSPRTVTTHLSRIYPKLGIRSRSELARALGNT